MKAPAKAGGTLFLVATPIGNPKDIGARAGECLRDVDLIAAEDTRIARTLLNHLGIAAGGRLLSLYESNEGARVAQLLEALRAGRHVALISDAGTPLVSDPGYRLVNAAIEAELPLAVVPGPCAAIAALTLSGLPTDRFLFCGFLPRKRSRRQAAIAALRDEAATLVLYESPHRVTATLDDLHAVLGDRRAAMLRQLTKPEEETARGLLSELRAHIGDHRVHGEVTLVVAGSDAAARDATAAPQVETLVAELGELGLSARQIRDVAHKVFGGDKRQLYRLALANSQR